MLSLIVESDLDWATIISSTIQRESEDVAVVDSISQAIRFVSLKVPDMFIIDAEQPDGSGLELCGKFREQFPDTPSIIVSAMGRPSDVVEGLMVGADDYVAKPFHPSEFRARVDTIRRRYRVVTNSANPNSQPVVSMGRLHLEFEPPGVFVDDVDAQFTPMEVRIFAQLVRYRGQTLRHEFIAEEIWGYRDKHSRTLVKGHIGSIRRKIRKAGGNGDDIRTIHGIGYCFSPVNE